MYYKIEQLKNILANHKNCVFSLDRLCSSALKYIQQLETSIDCFYELEKRVESARPKWISVEERLPEKTGGMLICAFGIVMSVTHVGNGVLITTDLDTWNIKDKYVTHWMPLPEPPKEET